MSFSIEDVELYLKVWQYPDGTTYVTIIPADPSPGFTTTVLAGEPRVQDGKGMCVLTARVDMNGLFHAMADELGVGVLGLIGAAKVEVQEVQCDCPRCVARREHERANAN